MRTFFSLGIYKEDKRIRIEVCLEQSDGETPIFADLAILYLFTDRFFSICLCLYLDLYQSLKIV